MKLYPDYSLNIVVGVAAGGRFQWFVTEKELWFLNSVKFANAFGLQATQEEEAILYALVRGDAGPFLKAIAEFSVAAEELKELVGLYVEERENDVFDVLPSTVVDFDARKLWNAFPEPSGLFEDYVPRGGWVFAARSMVNWFGRFPTVNATGTGLTWVFEF